MTFAYPWVLSLLLLVPLVAAFLFLPTLVRRRTPAFVFPGVALLLEQRRGWRTWLSWLPNALMLVALILTNIALARPQSERPEEATVEGIDIMIAFDLSGSMQAIDIEPAELRRYQQRGVVPKNRFEEAVEVLKEFVQMREYDRIGLVIFAREAYLQFPLTLDRRTVINMLDRMKIGDIDPAGTAIGNAMGRSILSLKESDARTRIVILITDGDRRGGNISPLQAAEMAKSLGIVVHPILVGKEGMTFVPGGRDMFTGQQTYREAEFPIDPELLQEIAEKTGGTYHRAELAQDMRQDLHEILDHYERTRIQDVASVRPNEHFHLFLRWAVILLGLQFILRMSVLRRFP